MFKNLFGEIDKSAQQTKQKNQVRCKAMKNPVNVSFHSNLSLEQLLDEQKQRSSKLEYCLRLNVSKVCKLEKLLEDQSKKLQNNDLEEQSDGDDDDAFSLISVHDTDDLIEKAQDGFVVVAMDDHTPTGYVKVRIAGKPETPQASMTGSAKDAKNSAVQDSEDGSIVGTSSNVARMPEKDAEDGKVKDTTPKRRGHSQNQQDSPFSSDSEGEKKMKALPQKSPPSGSRSLRSRTVLFTATPAATAAKSRKRGGSQQRKASPEKAKSPKSDESNKKRQKKG